MPRNVFAKTLRDQRRSLLWWTVGLVAVAAIPLVLLGFALWSLNRRDIAA